MTLDNSHVTVCDGAGGPVFAASIPTLSGGSMIAMTVLLLLTALIFLRRRAVSIPG